MVLRLKIYEDEENESIIIEADPKKTVKKTVADSKSYWSLHGDYKLLKDGYKINRRKPWSETDVEDGDELTLKKCSGLKRLPKNLWEDRIQNELERLQSSGIKFQKDKKNGVLSLEIMLEVPGPIKVGSDIGLSFKHRFTISLGREYPYQKPSLKWHTEIYHPNIKPPKDGGHIKTGFLKEWSFLNDLISLIENIESILMDPDIEYHLDEDLCKEATKRYMKGEFPSP